MKSENTRRLLVEGDVCLDVVGVPQAPQGDMDCSAEENWRLTGEIRTHLLPGGAMLLAEFVRNAVYAGARESAAALAGKNMEKKDNLRAEDDARRHCPPPQPEVVRGPMAVRPAALAAQAGAEVVMDTQTFLTIDDAEHFTPALLPAPTQLPLHANACLFGRLVGTAYPYSADDRDRIAAVIHCHYLEQRKAKGEHKPQKPSHQAWASLPGRFRDSNREQADDIPCKLLALGYWLRKAGPARPDGDPGLRAIPQLELTNDEAEVAARREHDRRVARERRKGNIWAKMTDPQPPFTHPRILLWGDPGFPDNEKTKDLDAIYHIPRYLAAAGYEVFKP